MTLSSSSTLTEIKAAYLDNAGYAASGSTAEAQAFLTACTMLLLVLPKRTSRSGSHELELDLEQVRRQQERAEQWLASAARASSGRTVHPDFTTFRD